jgi:hypothetical protein
MTFLCGSINAMPILRNKTDTMLLTQLNLDMVFFFRPLHGYHFFYLMCKTCVLFGHESPKFGAFFRSSDLVVWVDEFLSLFL